MSSIGLKLQLNSDLQWAVWEKRCWALLWLLDPIKYIGGVLNPICWFDVLITSARGELCLNRGHDEVLWLLLNRDLGFLMLEQCVCDMWQYMTHLNLITRVESGCLIMSRSWEGEVSAELETEVLLLSTPGFRDGRRIGRLIEMEVSNAIRRLPMGRSSDEFKAEILMPGT